MPTLDYVLYEGTVGAGLRMKWSADSKSLFALGYDRVAVRLIDYDIDTPATPRSSSRTT